MQNQNSVEYLEKIKVKIFENLKETTFVPSVELQDIPRISFGMDDEDDAMLDDLDEDENPDVRMTQRRRDETIEASGELSESEDEDSDFLGPKGKKLGGRRNEANFQEAGSGLSDIDETGSPSSEVSASPKSNANESEPEDVEMKDVESAMEDPETEPHTNGTSERGDGSPLKDPSRNSSESPNFDDAVEPENATDSKLLGEETLAAVNTIENEPVDEEVTKGSL
jgi:histone deacetylase 1/2